MALKLKKFEKMVRGYPIDKQESYQKETVDQIKLAELEHLQQRIFVNSFNHIDDDILREKCSDISAHYRLFKDDETHYTAPELSNDEKSKFKSCINNCINIECASIINEKECISTDLLQLVKSEHDMPNVLKNKLSTLLSLLVQYTNNKNEINNYIFKLSDSSYVNILEAQQLSKQIDVVKTNTLLLQSDIINKFSCSEGLNKSLEKYYNTKKKEYEISLKDLESLKELQTKYEQVDGPQYKELVKRFTQIQTITKAKTELFNNL